MFPLGLGPSTLKRRSSNQGEVQAEAEFQSGQSSNQVTVPTGAQFQLGKSSNKGKVTIRVGFQQGQGSCEVRVHSNKVHALLNVLPIEIY